MKLEIRDLEYQGTDVMFDGNFVENHPIDFPSKGGEAISNLFYWANGYAPNDDSFIDIHPHQAVEIISFDLEGVITHYDNKIAKNVELQKGDYQYIYAGSGVYHSEGIKKGGRMFQIWFDPDYKNNLDQEPEYKHVKAEELKYIDENNYQVQKLVGKGAPLQIKTKGVSIKKYKSSNDFILPIKENTKSVAYILNGSAKVNGNDLNEKDVFIVSETLECPIEVTSSELELFVINVVEKPDYITLDKLIKQLED